MFLKNLVICKSKLSGNSNCFKDFCPPVPKNSFRESKDRVSFAQKYNSNNAYENFDLPKLGNKTSVEIGQPSTGHKEKEKS